MQQKVTLTRLNRSTTDKDGNPLMGRNGKPYTRLGIQTVEYADKWLSGFGGYTNEKWKEGDVVTIDVTQNGEYLNFSSLSKIDLLEKRVEALEAQINTPKNLAPISPTQPVAQHVQPMQQQVVPNYTAPVEQSYDQGINPDEIPF